MKTLLVRLHEAVQKHRHDCVGDPLFEEVLNLEVALCDLVEARREKREKQSFDRIVKLESIIRREAKK